MMKKNTILKILSFVLVLTMVVAAVLLTGCGNKKEDPKASQAELDAAKAALEAAQAEIEKIQANIDKMTKDGSATADDLKKAQEELEAAQKALEELSQDTTAVVSEDVYEALYGKDSDKSIVKYQKKVEELAAAKTNRYYIVGYDADEAGVMIKFKGEPTKPVLPEVPTAVLLVPDAVEAPDDVTNPVDNDENAYPLEDNGVNYATKADHQLAYDQFLLDQAAYEAYDAYVTYVTVKADYDALFAEDAEEPTISDIEEAATDLDRAIVTARNKGIVDDATWRIYVAYRAKYQAAFDQYVIDLADYYTAVASYNADKDTTEWLYGNYQAYLGSEVYSVYKTCMNWVTSRLELATNAGVIDQAWADMEAAFAGIKKIVDKYDDELASLMPDANGGKLTVIKYDRYGNAIDQLEDLVDYHEWIRTQPKLKFNDATTDGSEAPSEKNYKALLAAYAKIWYVDAADQAAVAKAKDYGVEDTSALTIEFKTIDNKVHQIDKEINDALGKFYTNFVVYYEVTEKIGNEDVTNIYLPNDYSKIKAETFEYTGKYVFEGKELFQVMNGNKPTGKFKVKAIGTSDETGVNVVVKAFKFADVFTKDANDDAQYYAAADLTTELSGNAMYFARDARYTELLAAKAEFASLYTQMATLKNYKTNLPLYSNCAALEGDLKKLADFQEKYKLAQVTTYSDNEIAKMELSGDALDAFKEQNDENKRMNALNLTICIQIFTQIDNGANAYGGYNRIYTISEIVKALKTLREELVDPAVEDSSKSLAALFAEWKSTNVDAVKYADYKIYKDADKRLNGYWGEDENGEDLWVDGVYSAINTPDQDSKYYIFTKYNNTEKNNVVYDILDLTLSEYNTVKGLLSRAATLDIINTKVEKLAEAFRDGGTVDNITYTAMTKVAKTTDDLTGKETTEKVLDKKTGKTERRYFVVTFKTNNQIDDFAADIDGVFATYLSGCFDTEGVIKAEYKENYDFILKETKAAEFLEQATKTFDALKQPFVDAYKAVKDVIYSIDVDDDGNETLVPEKGEYLQTLANLLWARDTIATLESNVAYKGNDFTNSAAGHSGQFKVDAIETTAYDVTTTTTIKYGDFRTVLNNAVAKVTLQAGLANAEAATNINTLLDAKTVIVEKTTKMGDLEVASPKLSAYTSLNQNAAVDTVVANFREWCVKYLGAEQTYEKDVLDEDGEPNGFTYPESYTDAEFFANVAKYFTAATADGKATGILNVKISGIAYTFVSAENFAILQTIDATKDTLTENARATFVAMLNNKTLLPAYATKVYIDSVCAQFVNYVKSFYMQNGESLDAVYAYYNEKEGYFDLNAKEYAASNGTKKVRETLEKETWVEKAARYASYILENGTDHVINPEDEVALWETVNDKDLYNQLAQFIADFNTVVDQTSANTFLGKYPYTSMVANNGEKYSLAN